MATVLDHIPPPFAFLDSSDRSSSSLRNMWGHFRRFSALLGRQDANSSPMSPAAPVDPSTCEGSTAPADGPAMPPAPFLVAEDDPRLRCPRRPSRRAIARLPRPGTFKRQESERRERLMPHHGSNTERRALSVDPRRTFSPRRLFSPATRPLPSSSAPEVSATAEDDDPVQFVTGPALTREPAELVDLAAPEPQQSPPPPPFSPVSAYSDAGLVSEAVDDQVLADELERRWILNLSMLFRDRSDREKFFVTFAQTPTLWRRVTVSCDYRDAPPDSLELDLKALRYQREKNARIYESIRESLEDIQFYKTVTNLKLQTTDGRLHVHVTEDVNEIIPYPPLIAVAHLPCPRYRERDVGFDAHLSGYVYRVLVHGRRLVKKEIPGPDSVDEFLYEINALHDLNGSSSVIRFCGIIVDDDEKCVKGLLIDFAAQGALIDLLYDEKGRLPWPRRERWAKQIVQGLSEIHEAGFVQGDFTLSNIVIDADDDAKIIDINRRGCPVGWEPPEVAALIESNQRISMYIGVKSDIFQLGMVLWALAMEQDEPEMQPRPLTLAGLDGIAEYYPRIVEACLSERPQGRWSAKEVLAEFPDIDPVRSRPEVQRRPREASLSEQRYIDPSHAVEREDLDRFGRLQPATDDRSQGLLAEGTTYLSTGQSCDTGYGSAYVVSRGRAGVHRDSLDRSPSTRPSNGLVTDDETAEAEAEAQIVAISPDGARWEEVQVEGHPYLIDRRSFDGSEPVGDGEVFGATSKALSLIDGSEPVGDGEVFGATSKALSLIDGNVMGKPEARPSEAGPAEVQLKPEDAQAPSASSADAARMLAKSQVAGGGIEENVAVPGDAQGDD